MEEREGGSRDDPHGRMLSICLSCWVITVKSDTLNGVSLRKTKHTEVEVSKLSENNYWSFKTQQFDLCSFVSLDIRQREMLLVHVHHRIAALSWSLPLHNFMNSTTHIFLMKYSKAYFTTYPCRQRGIFKLQKPKYTLTDNYCQEISSGPAK